MLAVAEKAQVNERTLRYIMSSDADRGVYKRTAVNILSIKVMPVGHAKVDGRPTQRRLEALACMGWSRKYVADAAKLTTSGLRPSSLDVVLASTDAAVADVYNSLKMRASPMKSAAQTVRTARAAGFAPPWAWPNGSIADPEALPVLSEVEDREWRKRIAERYSSSKV
jgi:hypothetical protein